MTGKITPAVEIQLTHTENPSPLPTTSPIQRTSDQNSMTPDSTPLHNKTVNQGRSTESIEKQFFDYCEKNFSLTIGSQSKAQLTSTLLYSIANNQASTKNMKLDFIEAYTPFLLLHFKEPIFEDHLFACLSMTKKLKADPEFHPRIKAIEDQIRNALEPENSVTHAQVLKSLDDIKALPLYHDHHEIEAAIGPDHMWRLVLDGAVQHDPEDPNGGIAGYESREKGSVERLQHGYTFTLSQEIFSPITTDFIRAIHKNVASLAVAEIREAGQWGGSGVSCSYARIYTPADANGLKYIQSGNFSHSGAFENMVDTKDLLMPSTSDISLNESLEKPKLKFESSHDGNPEGNMQKLIDAYETKMASIPLSNRYERLKTIVQFIHIAEINHPFQDGNCRTLCTCLLNRELIRHGFPPTLLWDPNYFDMLSTDEMMLEVLEGMKDFDTLAKTKTYAREMTPEMMAVRRNQKMNTIVEQLKTPSVNFMEKLQTIKGLTALEKEFITELDLKSVANSGLNDESLGILLNTLPNLTELSISNYRTDHTKLFTQDKTYPNMKEFSYMNTIIIPDDLSAYMARFPNLETLTFSNVNFSPINPRFVIPDVYGHLPHLKELNFSTKNIHNPEAQALSAVINLRLHLDALVKSAPNLERVFLPKNFATEDLEDFKGRYPNVQFSVEV